ncbi:MAG TPA: hypothetical protein VMR08_01505 [Patescibacteria group bacterium]|nr:hypothetical protein [Patescibacteria group bacterium]
MKDFVKRITALAVAVVFFVAGIIAAISSRASAAPFAYNLISSRNIIMSDTHVSDSGVSYQIGFTPNTSATIKGIVVDFCSTNPLIGETCTPPPGFSITTTPVVATSGGVNTGLTGTWTASYLVNSTQDSILTLINASGVALSSSIPVIFTLSTVANPSAPAATFYARILDYQNNLGATNYNSTAPTDGGLYPIQDAGGIALSTVSQLTITSKVQEQLIFCIDTNSAANCGAASGTSILLGDTQDVLSTSGPFVDKTAQYIIQTNASQGANINIKGDTLKYGTSSITATGTGALSINGQNQFGMCTYESSGSNLTPNANYNGTAAGGSACSAGNSSQSANTGTPGGAGTVGWAFNTTNTTGTFGDTIASATAGAQSTGTLCFLANVAPTTTAGIYQTILTFIATGKF